MVGMSAEEMKERGNLDLNLFLIASLCGGSEMAEYMRRVAEKKSSELSVEERNLLSVSYKNAIGARRMAWRTTFQGEAKEKAKIEQYRKEARVCYLLPVPLSFRLLLPSLQLTRACTVLCVVLRARMRRQSASKRTPFTAASTGPKSRKSCSKSALMCYISSTLTSYQK
jgi:hypothetical protein